MAPSHHILSRVAFSFSLDIHRKKEELNRDRLILHNSLNRRVMSRNKEKQKNVLNRLYLSKTNPRKLTTSFPIISNLHLAKARRPHLVSSIFTNPSPHNLFYSVSNSYGRWSPTMVSSNRTRNSHNLSGKFHLVFRCIWWRLYSSKQDQFVIQIKRSKKCINKSRT